MRKRPVNKRANRIPAADILRRLASADAGPAWLEFIDRYSPLIMKVVNRFEFRQRRASDCYLHVCEQLNDDGFRRLLRFNATGVVRFRTWLATVTFNLCVDWHRREFGRATLLPAVTALSAFDQAVYRLVIEQEMDKETAFQTLRADHPDLTRDVVRKSVVRVNGILTPRQRWQITVRHQRRRQTVIGSPRQPDSLPNPTTSPEDELRKQQDLDKLRWAMRRLSSQQRLLLHLRFQEGLSLQKIADLMQLGNSSRAWRQLEAALRAVFEAMQEKNPAQKRKS
jgi:RNA polymerase sigma factor (sigma-70 family)